MKNKELIDRILRYGIAALGILVLITVFMPMMRVAGGDVYTDYVAGFLGGKGNVSGIKFLFGITEHVKDEAADVTYYLTKYSFLALLSFLLVIAGIVCSVIADKNSKVKQGLTAAFFIAAFILMIIAVANYNKCFNVIETCYGTNRYINGLSNETLKSNYAEDMAEIGKHVKVQIGAILFMVFSLLASCASVFRVTLNSIKNKK